MFSYVSELDWTTDYDRIMSEEQQKLIHLAKASAQRHLSIIISNPDVYLGTFRYGMDFVWGKFVLHKTNSQTSIPC